MFKASNNKIVSSNKKFDRIIVDLFKSKKLKHNKFGNLTCLLNIIVK